MMIQKSVSLNHVDIALCAEYGGMSNLPICICDHLIQAARLKTDVQFEAWN